MFYCFGLYCISIIKCFYNSPLPFWVDPDIIPIGHCELSYGNPTVTQYNIVFFLTYNVYMYLSKYSANQNTLLVYFLYFLIICCSLLMTFVSAASGRTYFNQTLISVFFSFSYLVMAILLDDIVLILSENIGFIVRQSRKYKFLLLFFCIGMLAISIGAN